MDVHGPRGECARSGPQVVDRGPAAADAGGCDPARGHLGLGVEEGHAPSLAGELTVLDQVSQAPVHGPIELLDGIGESDRVRHREGEDVGLDPLGRRLDELDLHPRRRIV